MGKCEWFLWPTWLDRRGCHTTAQGSWEWEKAFCGLALARTDAPLFPLEKMLGWKTSWSPCYFILISSSALVCWVILERTIRDLERAHAMCWPILTSEQLNSSWFDAFVCTWDQKDPICICVAVVTEMGINLSEFSVTAMWQHRAPGRLHTL